MRYTSSRAGFLCLYNLAQTQHVISSRRVARHPSVNQWARRPGSCSHALALA